MVSKSFFRDVLICSFIVFLFLIVSFYFYGFFRLGDDTFIYLQYARSLIEHNEFSFNRGEPIFGFTSPLWLILLTITVKITDSYLQSPHILTLLFSVLTIIVWFITLKKFPLNAVTRFLLLLLISFDPNLLKHSYLGMEASASLFLSSVCVLILLSEERGHLKIILPILFGFYFLLRPESLFIYLILILVLLISKKIEFNNVFTMLILTLLIITPWFIFSLLYFGSLLPTTLSAKGAGYGLGMKFLTHFLDSIKIFLGNYLLVIMGIILSLLVGGWNKIFINYKNLFYFSIISITGLIIFYCLLLNKEIVYARYYCMVFPFIYLLLLIVLIVYKAKLKLVYYFLSSVILYSIVITVIFSNLTKSVSQDDIIEDKIAIWIKENSALSDLIVRGRIGKIGFLSKRKIIDPMGIINPEIIEYNKHNRSFEYYAKIKPRYFIGSFDIQILQKYGFVIMVKEFKGIQALLPRHLIFAESELTTIPIYKVDWY